MIYVNARFLTQRMTGVQRFALEICLQLKKMHRDNITFLAPHNIQYEEESKQLNVQVIGKSKGHYWEQIELPYYLKNKKDSILLNLGNTAPLFCKNNIVTLHDVIYKLYPKSFGILFATVYKLLVPILLKRALAIFTVSDFSKNEIIKHYQVDSKGIHTIYNAVSSSFYPRQNEKSCLSEKYFLAVSSNLYHKNFEGMVKAFVNLNLDKNIKLKVVGKINKAVQRILDNVPQHKDNVEFLGRVSDEQLVNLYTNAYCFIIPSFYEGFGIPPLEAQQCGCPVIASNKASMPEVLADSALYFDPYCIDEMTSIMNKIISDPELRLEMIRKGYRNINRFSWEKSAEKVSYLLCKYNGEVK